MKEVGLASTVAHVSPSATDEHLLLDTCSVRTIGVLKSGLALRTSELELSLVAPAARSPYQC